MKIHYGTLMVGFQLTQAFKLRTVTETVTCMDALGNCSCVTLPPASMQS